MFKRIMACFMLVLFTALHISVSAAGPQTEETHARTVKVGHIGYDSEREDFIKQFPTPISSFNTDYLNKIATYNNWEYEFISGSLDECLDRLEKGEIDLMGPLQYSAERDLVFDYPKLEFGHEYTALYCNNDSRKYYYEDFKSFNGMKVGLIKSNYNNFAFDQYCTDNRFNVNKSFYPDELSLVAALENGTVDGIVVSRIVSNSSVKTLASFGFEPYYYATTQGNKEILDSLNYALTKLNMEDPNYEINLYNKYYPNGNIEGDTRLTRQEANYIEKNPVINFTAYTDWPVVSSKDTSSSNAGGIAVDLVNNVGGRVNLKFRQVNSGTYSESLNTLQTKQTQVALVVDGLYDKSTMVCSNPLLSVPLLLVSDQTQLPQSSPKISIFNADQYAELIPYLPNDAVLIDCLDIYSCIEAIKDGEADATIIDSYMLDYLNKIGKYGQLQAVSTINRNASISLATLKSTDPSLISIINKSIGQIKQTDINTAIVKHTVQKNYQLGFKQFFSSYSNLFITLVILAMVSLIILLVIHRFRIKKSTRTIAYTDSLLGIRNFEKFKVDAAELFTKFKRDDFSLIYFDINRFKYINDNFGYRTGNEILSHVAGCAIDQLYEYELFARVSSDNFVMLLKNIDENLIVQTIKKLSRTVAINPITAQSGHQITLCYGIYRLPAEYEDIYTSLDRANAARKTIKGSYATTYSFYNDKMLRQLAHEVQLTAAMPIALENGEFKLYLQPKHDVSNNNVIGAEALVRWCPPNKPVIQPNDFIPLMEKTGFITQIDFLMFDEVCKALRHMIDNGFTIYPISVNLSRVHMQSRDFIQRLYSTIVSYNIPPSLIELELTETMILQNQKEVLNIMHTLKEIGFKISLDDFGTGYSSLGLLMEMPVDILKLDKSFLSEVIATPKERTILNDIINMAHHLSMSVVSEGVETHEQLGLLSEISCDIAQGFLFSKPIPVESYFEYIL